MFCEAVAGIGVSANSGLGASIGKARLYWEGEVFDDVDFDRKSWKLFDLFLITKLS